MPKAWTDRKLIIGRRGGWGVGSSVLFWLGVVFSILGIISKVRNAAVGLGAVSWLLLAALVFVVSLFLLLSWALGMLLDAIEAKGKKEE